MLVDGVAEDGRERVSHERRQEDQRDDGVGLPVVEFELDGSVVRVPGCLRSSIRTYGMIAPYAASLAPIIRPHQKVALSLQIVVLDSFHRGAMLIACDGGVSSGWDVGLDSWETRQSCSLGVSVVIVIVAILPILC